MNHTSHLKNKHKDEVLKCIQPFLSFVPNQEEQQKLYDLDPEFLQRSGLSLHRVIPIILRSLNLAV